MNFELHSYPDLTLSIELESDDCFLLVVKSFSDFHQCKFYYDEIDAKTWPLIFTLKAIELIWLFYDIEDKGRRHEDIRDMQLFANQILEKLSNNKNE